MDESRYFPIEDYEKEMCKKPLTQGILHSNDIPRALSSGSNTPDKSSCGTNTSNHKTMEVSGAAVENLFIVEESQFQEVALPQTDNVKVQVVCHEPHTIHATMGASSNLMGIPDKVSVDTSLLFDIKYSGSQEVSVPLSDSAHLLQGGNGASNSTIPTDKVKLKHKVIPSRYMSQATSNKGNELPKAFNKSSRSLHTMSNESRNDHNMSLSTASNSASKQLKRNASTRVQNDGTLFDADVSAINPKSSGRHASKLQDNKRSAIGSGGEGDGRQIVDQRTLDLAYSDYIRMKYILMQLDKSGEQRHKKALADVKEMVERNAELEREVCQLEEDVMVLKHADQTDQLISAQEQALKPAMAKLDETVDKYKVMGDHVDAVRHGMPAEDIKLPDLSVLLHLVHNIKRTLDHNEILQEEKSDAAEAIAELDKLAQQEASFLDEVGDSQKIFRDKQRQLFVLQSQLETEQMLINNN